MDEVEAQVRRLQSRVDALSGKKAAADDSGRHAVVWRNLPIADQAVELQELAGWVEWLQVRYASAGDWLRPCWWRHGFVVEELSALRTAWLGVYEPAENAEAMAALDWHEAAEKCRERVRQVISTGPGCTAVAHKDDQPVADDPRWIEERVAMGGSDPETSTKLVEEANSTSESSVEE
ncbi:MAG: hypothetical protein ABSB09_09030 [Acidimicrobiales bacterium]|jgi:hypothetical protein